MAFKLPKLNIKGTNIKEGMDKKYGHGEYSRGGKKFEERMKPGESKFNYDVRMKKEDRKRAMGTDIESIDIQEENDPYWDEQGYVQGVHGNLTPEPPNLNDLRDQSQVQNYGITLEMDFQQAHAQAGKMGATKNSPPFTWFNPKTQQTEQFIYELKKDQKNIGEELQKKYKGRKQTTDKAGERIGYGGIEDEKGNTMTLEEWRLRQTQEKRSKRI